MNTSKLWAGASGYAFKEWKGSFYPEKMQPEAMLAWYAERLPAVEINNTFYQMPKVAVLAHWGRGDARDVSLRDQGVAPHHPRCAPQGRRGDRLVCLPLANLATLGAKRGPVLFQLPPFLKKDLPRLGEFLQLLPEGHQAVFEFRNDSWFDDDVYAALQAAGAALCLSERRTMRRRRSSRPRPGATRGCASRTTRRTTSPSGFAGSQRHVGRSPTCTSCTNRRLRAMRRPCCVWMRPREKSNDNTHSHRSRGEARHLQRALATTGRGPVQRPRPDRGEKLKGAFTWHPARRHRRLLPGAEGQRDDPPARGRRDARAGAVVRRAAPSVEHCPVAEEGAEVLLIERAGTPNTGDAATAALRREI